MLPRIGIFIVGFLLVGCSHVPMSPDDADWQEMAPKVTGYTASDEMAVRQHLVNYPNCKHRAAAEDFYVTRCTKDRSSCHEYFDQFPAGDRKSELEPVIWQACEVDHGETLHFFPACGGDCCELYRAKYPDGSKITTVKQILDHDSKIQAAEARETAATEKIRKMRNTRAWNGRIVDLIVEYPPAGNEVLGRLRYTVAGRTLDLERITPTTVSVPSEYPIEVCSNNPLFACATVWPRGNTLRVPLTRVFVLYEKAVQDLNPTCSYNGSLGEAQKKSSGDAVGNYEEFWTLPGDHYAGCQFFGTTQFGDPVSESVGTELETGEISLPFSAPDQGGTVYLFFSRDKKKIRGKTKVSPCWEQGPQNLLNTRC